MFAIEFNDGCPVHVYSCTSHDSLLDAVRDLLHRERVVIPVQQQQQVFLMLNHPCQLHKSDGPPLAKKCKLGLVNNRDISIAVLKTFISKQKQEHESSLSRRKKGPSKIPEEPISETEAPIVSDPEATTHFVNAKSNAPCEVSEVIFHDQPCSIGKEPLVTHEGKVQGELKPPRVLEAVEYLHSQFYWL